MGLTRRVLTPSCGYDPGHMSTLPPPPLGPVSHVGPPPASGRAITAMVLGIIGLVSGFAVVTLLCAVAANVLGSIALHEIDESGGRLGGRSQAIAGIACASAALVVWIALIAVLAATGNLE